MKIHTIGGYDEVGKNMTALEIGEDVLLFDCGIFLPAIVGVEEREKIPTERGMRNLGALPEDIYLDKKGLRKKTNLKKIKKKNQGENLINLGIQSSYLGIFSEITLFLMFPNDFWQEEGKVSKNTYGSYSPEIE